MSYNHQFRKKTLSFYLQKQTWQLVITIPKAAARISVFASDFTTKTVDYASKKQLNSGTVENIVDQLTVEEMIELVRGGDLQSYNSEHHQIMGAGGKTCISLLDRQIPNVLFSDGSAGINIMEEVVYLKGFEIATKEANPKAIITNSMEHTLENE